MVYKLPNYNRYLIGIKPKVGEPVTSTFATKSSLEKHKQNTTNLHIL